MGEMNIDRRHARQAREMPARLMQAVMGVAIIVKMAHLNDEHRRLSTCSGHRRMHGTERNAPAPCDGLTKVGFAGPSCSAPAGPVKIDTNYLYIESSDDNCFLGARLSQKGHFKAERGGQSGGEQLE